jgi:site-specific DNA-methyltransferase (adenine-specific)
MLKLFHGDCLKVLPTLEENSVDSIVTDPPYELGFMGKKWDATGIAFNVDVWREAYRVLKPGGHLLAFSGSRTYHRMAVAIEDAGFEIRDQIMWVYGSGFPKSMAIDKQLDKQLGVEREVVGRNPNSRENSTKDNTLFESGTVGKTDYITKPSSEEAKKWEGWGTALKPAHEPIVLARKPLEGTVVNNILTYGVGGINIDDSRVPGESIPINKLEMWSGFGEKVKPEYEQEMNNKGRFPANLIHDGSEEVIELFPRAKGGAYPAKRGKAVATTFASGQETEGGFRAMGDDGSAARFFYCAKANKRDRNDGLDGFEVKRPDTRTKTGMGTFDEKGVAAQSNHHPTVKPIALMQYLVRLITPPTGIVLDPFMGSGSTGKACMYEGFSFIGIDQSEEYVKISQARIDFAIKDSKE